MALWLVLYAVILGLNGVRDETSLSMATFVVLARKLRRLSATGHSQ
ncbi:MAG: hypothetical protein J7L37_05590 [Thermococcus sp.]|nr:hypothetical protein [Thermococcus sp.]